MSRTFDTFGRTLTVGGEIYFSIGTIAEGFVISKTDKVEIGMTGFFEGQTFAVVAVVQNRTTTAIQARATGGVK